MARLNEPPVPADSLDTLRRRFLRQNRDIARINSNQSLRIRGLENECARLLSENLDLRGQVLHMEKELDERSSRCASDKALQLKEKMEVHLVELGALLAGFGLEPPTKKQSPSAPRRSSRPPRMSLQLQRRPPQLSPREAESLAAQEGRLAPIFENKTYPRQTLNREEILATQSDPVDTTDSPELGPPPISRLLRDESRRSMPSPSKSTTSETEPAAAASADGKDRTTKSSSSTPAADCGVEIMALPTPDPPRMMPTMNSPGTQLSDTEKKLPPRSKAVSRKLADLAAESEMVGSKTVSANESSSVQVQRVGAKRKFAVSDENAVVQGMKAVGDEKSLALGKGQFENVLPIRELKNPKGIKDLASSRKALSDGNVEGKGRSGARKPLATKSTNDDISSPRKRTERTERADDVAAACKNNTNTDGNKATATARQMRDRIKMSVMSDNSQSQPSGLAEAEIDGREEAKPAMPYVAAMGLESLENARPISPSPQAEALCPNTPPSTSAALSSGKPLSMLVEGRDTPPPSDISSQGEVPRPNRRARASVSYAEPNLRDKMRRPTKELLDAVTGEGRYLQRQHHQGQGEADGIRQQQAPMVETPTPTGSYSTTSVVDTPVKPEAAHSAAERLEQLQADPQSAPSRSMSIDRRKRTSTAWTREASENRHLDPSASAGKASTGSLGHSPDLYEFTISSPQAKPMDSHRLTTEEGYPVIADGRGGDSGRRSASGNSGTRSSSKTTRRSSAATLRDDVSTSTVPAAAERPTRTITTTTRKRTSMVTLKKASMLNGEEDEDDPADSSYEPQVGSGEDEVRGTEGQMLSARDRISRRRSMML